MIAIVCIVFGDTSLPIKWQRSHAFSSGKAQSHEKSTIVAIDGMALKL
ncbi:hypothetical protein [Rhodovulum adriaticum]|nr:hypothetical protein [Rhodovulum adriaticum]